MARRQVSEADRDRIEQIVDKTDLAAVLVALADIAMLKADHIRENWDDKHLARSWDSDAGKLAVLSQKVNN